MNTQRLDKIYRLRRRPSILLVCVAEIKEGYQSLHYYLENG